MDRLSFFKQGLSSVMEAASSLIGLKKAADSFTEAVNDALSEVRTNIGLHLPTLDNEMYTGVETTLDRIAELGFTEIEVSAFYRGKVHLLPPAEFRALAKKAGLQITAAYLAKAPTLTSAERANYALPEAETEECAKSNSEAANEENNLAAKPAEANAPKQAKDPDTEWWETAIETYKQLGCKYITLAYQPEGDSDNAIEEFVEYAKLISSIAAKNEMRLCYHPETAALIPHEGVSALDKILAKCDTETLLLEIDTYEALAAGVDAKELIEHFGKRVALLHLHDEFNVGDSDKIDFNAVVKAASGQGVDNIYIEVHNFMQPPINCVEKSIYYVESLQSINY